MDIVEKLMKVLEAAKEELSKGMNQTPGMPSNMSKDDIVKPDKGYGKITIKQPPPKPKPESPYGKVIIKKMEELSCAENGQWKILEKDAADPKLAPQEVKVKQLQQQIDAGTYKPDPKKIAGAMLKEEEPHKDDPQHEAKEKEKAKKIKDEAQEILDLHKD